MLIIIIIAISGYPILTVVILPILIWLPFMIVETPETMLQDAPILVTITRDIIENFDDLIVLQYRYIIIPSYRRSNIQLSVYLSICIDIYIYINHTVTVTNTRGRHWVSRDLLLYLIKIEVNNHKTTSIIECCCYISISLFLTSLICWLHMVNVLCNIYLWY